MDCSKICVDEAISVLRYKDPRSTTLERLRVTHEADLQVEGLSQPLQLGEGLYYLLDRIAVPVSADDLIVGRILEEVPEQDGEHFFQSCLEKWNQKSIPPWMGDGGHECFAWDRLLQMGFSGLETFADQERARRLADGETGPVLDFLAGAIRVYQAFRNYARRYAVAAEEAGLVDSAANCAALSHRPPETFAEALQLIWLVGHVYCTMLAKNPTLTFGRMDVLLLDYYNRDLSLGRLTREAAGDLIEDFYCKNNLILGRGEHQMSGGSEKATGWARNLTYDAPQYVVLGGRRRNGLQVTDELTALFLERIVPRFENPVVVLRYTEDLPQNIWFLACEKMRANASFMVYNDEKIIPAMTHCGIEENDAVTYTMHGCNWPDIPGVQRTVRTHIVSLPNHVREALFSLDKEPEDMETVYCAFLDRVKQDVEAVYDQVREDRKSWASKTPGRLRVDDCFLDGPVARGRSWQLGGVKYNTVVSAIVGIASAADSLAAVDALVFRSKKMKLDTLKEALDDDFSGQERLRRMCLHASKFGQDDERADQHAVNILEAVQEQIDRASRVGSEDGVIVFRCLETDMRHIRLGQTLAATPDGRRNGQPISENTSPYPGASRNGITAMLRSVAKLPLHGINSGALNVRMQPRLFAGDDGLERLAALLRAYFDMGGLQVQLSFADVEELRHAQLYPEQHRDLMIRITGYSAAFVDMDRQAQDEIIRREEMGVC
jgi:trans-4-hydroxy-L-proline dehydratase